MARSLAEINGNMRLLHISLSYRITVKLDLALLNQQINNHRPLPVKARKIVLNIWKGYSIKACKGY